MCLLLDHSDLSAFILVSSKACEHNKGAMMVRSMLL